MPVAVLGSCRALGGGGGSASGRAEAGSVLVGVVVADGGCGGPGRAADEGVARVVPGPPAAVLDARGASGGGVQGGISHGETDEIGLKSIVNKVTIHDLHATILHQLGVDHEQLSYNINGLDVKLTGVEGARVIEDILKTPKS